MEALQCKMCGRNLIPVDVTVCKCDYCGTRQTIPKGNDKKKIDLFNRANRLRMNGEFDEAYAMYETIVAEFPDEAEAYWGLCLCSYGIEYVDDPATGTKKPICHRTLPSSIMENGLSIDNQPYYHKANFPAKNEYRDMFFEINCIQKDILSIAASEKPYDVFICFNKTSKMGRRPEIIEPS